MTEKELNIVFNCLKDEEELEFETVGKMYNYIRKLEAVIKQLQNTAPNIGYKASPKLPKIKDSELLKCIENIQDAIKKLGNFI